MVIGVSFTTVIYLCWNFRVDSGGYERDDEYTRED
mgnify:CR=1 FL=1